MNMQRVRSVENAQPYRRYKSDPMIAVVETDAS